MNRMLTVSALLLTSLSLRAQQQTIFSRGQQATAPGSIEGVVVGADSGEPVAGAQLTLVGGGIATLTPIPLEIRGTIIPVAGAVGGGGTIIATAAPPPAAVRVSSIGSDGAPSATTSSDGRFSFTNLTASGYRITATANGFARQEYGQRAVNGPARLVYVGSGQAVRDIVIRLVPNGSVAGRVFDDNGRPATGAGIYILQPVYSAQGQTLQSMGEGSVDDRGDFRVFAVPPGHYYVLAGTPPGGPRPTVSGGARVPGARFALLYYPNAVDLQHALPIDVRPTAETFVDMRLSRQEQTYHVRGRVVSASGSALPPNVSVSMAYRFLTGSGGFSSIRGFDPATGAFDLQNVPPGDYAVQAQVPPPPLNAAPGPLDAAGAMARQAEQAPRLFGYVPIRVVNADVDGVVVTMSSGMSTTGRVVVEGQPAASIPNVERMRLTLLPTTSANSMVSTSPPVVFPPAADGTFQIVGLRDGEYRVQFSAIGLYVKSVQYGGEDIISKPFRFNGGALSTFEVTLRSSAARITGTVTDRQSRPVAGIQVVIIPSQRGRTDLYRTGFTDANGRFSSGPVPPGDYKLFSWEAVATGAYYGPGFLTQYESQGSAVRVADSSTQDVTVRLIVAP